MISTTDEHGTITFWHTQDDNDQHSNHATLEVSRTGCMWLVTEHYAHGARTDLVTDLLDEDQALDLAEALMAAVEKSRAIRSGGDLARLARHLDRVKADR